MTKIVFLLTCSFLLVAISVLFSQEILSDNSPEKLVLLDEKILADIPFPGNIYTVSKSGLVAFLVQSDQGYGLKKIFIKEGNTVIREISESGCTLFSLVFSNDSQWFKYGIREKSKAAKVKLINLKNGNTVEINNGNFDCGDLDFSPDNEKFVYRRDLGTGKARNTEIVISDFNQQAHVIAFNGNWPKWSPAGNNLAFTKVEHFENSTQWGKCIWLYDIEKNSESKVNGSAGMGTGLLSWSPSGKEIADLAEAGLYVLNIGSGSIKKIEGESYTGISSFSWSPDGSKIALGQSYYDQSNQDILVNSDILVVNSDGTGLANLTNTPFVMESDPVWMTNGRMLLKKRIDGKIKIVSFDIGIR